MKGKVLIIEQDKAYATALKKMLEDDGFEVTVFSSTAGVDMFLLFHDFDVIFLDIELWSSVDAFFVRVMNDVMVNTKMILTSKKYLNKALLKDAMDRGVYGCVHKPFSRNEVMPMVGGTSAGIGGKVLNLMKSLVIIASLLFFLILHSLSFGQDLQGVPSFVQTPRALAKWLSTEFNYRFELTDGWQSPQETIDSKEGDCEDFAILASRILNRLGISNDILVIKFRGLKIAHAICAWKEKDGTYSFISNRKLFRTGERELEDAIGKYYPDSESIIFTDEKRRYIGMVSRSN